MSTFERVSLWNQRANKLPAPVGTALYWQSLANQAKRIEEELVEVYEAINNKDISNLIKEGSDLDVVVSGFNYLAGSDYGSVINSTLDNNDLKITTSKGKAENWLIFHQDNGVDAFIDTYEGDDNYDFYTVKRKEDDKVLKYGNFPKVDISDYVPEPVEEKFVLIQDASRREEVKEKYGYEVLVMDSLEGEHLGFLTDNLEENGDLLMTIINGNLTGIESIEGE